MLPLLHNHRKLGQARLLAALVSLIMSACTVAKSPPLAPTASPSAVAQIAIPTPTINPIWQPAPGTSWQIQLSGLPVDQSVAAAVYDLDLFETDPGVVAALHAQGRKVICYMSAGSWENWRPDAVNVPPMVLGKALDGWPDERWLDIRHRDVLGPLIEARLDMCASKGFDGVDFDNVDGYTNSTGFPLTGADQLAFNRFLADAAHARGLAVGLKNDLDQVADLVDYFDFAINEQCFQYKTCDLLKPFIHANKAVFHVEYKLATTEFCPRALALGFSSIRKNRELDAYREPCSP